MYAEIKLKHGEKLLITKPLKDIESQINSVDFIRTHRSFVINIQHVKRYDSDKNMIVMSDNSTVQLARRRKEEFKNSLERVINK